MYSTKCSEMWKKSGIEISYKDYNKIFSESLKTIKEQLNKDTVSDNDYVEASILTDNLIVREEKKKLADEKRKEKYEKLKLERKNKKIKKDVVEVEKSNNLNNGYDIVHILPKQEEYILRHTEKYNIRKLMQIAYSGKCDYQTTYFIGQYIKQSRIIDDEIAIIEIEYQVPVMGRMKPTKKDRYIQSQAYQWSIVKSEACRDLYYDIDMTNAQVVLLEQLMTQNELPVNKIRLYNQSREDNLKYIMDNNNKTRKEAKQLVLKTIFDSTERVKKLLKNKNIKMNKITRDFIIQCCNNRKQLLALYPEAVRYSREACEKNGKNFNDNVDGKSYSKLAQHLERIALLSMYDFFTSKKLEMGGLIYDGLHLRKTPEMLAENGNIYLSNLLRECEDYIRINTGFSVELTNKEFDNLDYSGMENLIRFDSLKGIDEVKNLEIKRFNSKYLVRKEEEQYDICDHIDTSSIESCTSNYYKELDPDSDDYEQQEKENIEKKEKSKKAEKKIILVKSYTGSGKTTFLKKLVKDKTIISLTSRVSLADMHTNDFGIKNYRKVNYHDVNEVYQLDSLDKIPIDDIYGDFVLIIDEVASACQHLLNHMPKMSKNRISMVNIFKKLINKQNCKMVIGCDNNINTGTINFFRNLSDDKMELFINEYSEDLQAPVNVITSNDYFVESAISKINAGEKVFLCSNRKTKFLKDIVEPLIKKTKLDKSKYIVYSGETGPEDIDTKQWEDKLLIVATPTIIYGCDSNYGFHVYGKYYAYSEHFDAYDINQQINRERKPSSINLCMENLYTSDQYSDLSSTNEKTGLPIELNLSLSMDELQESFRVIKALKELILYEDYRRSHHLNIRLHVLDLLRTKGYRNISFITKRSFFDEVEEIEEELIVMQEASNRICENDYDSKQTKIIKQRLEMFELSSMIEDKEPVIEYEGQEDDYNYIDNNLGQYFVDGDKFKRMLLFSSYKSYKNSHIDFKDGKPIIKNKDIKESFVKQDAFKLYLLEELRVKLGIEKDDFKKETNCAFDSIDKDNYEESIDLDDKFIESFNKAFKIRKDKNKIVNTREYWTCAYTNKLRSFLGSSIMTTGSRSKRINKTKKISISRWNYKTINEMYHIYDYSTKVRDSRSMRKVLEKCVFEC